MTVPVDRRYRISEVSKLTGVPVHVLRQWEEKITQLKPKRDRNERRYYTQADIDVVQEIKYQRLHKGATLKGASLALSKDWYRKGRFENPQAIVDLLDKMEDELRAMIHLVDAV
jgi:DNA-binding transcriptional MerR regulator